MSNTIGTPQIKRLLISHGFMIFARQMLVIFFTLFIWNLTGSLADIAIFHIVFYLSHCIFFHAFAPLVKKGYANGIKMLGLSGLILFYSFLLFLGDSAAEHLMAIGFLWGIVNSMYWLSYHVQNFDATHNSNRGNYAGMERTLRISMSIVSPALGGYLITINAFGIGYGNIFLFGALMLVGALIFAKVDSSPKSDYRFEMRSTLRAMVASSDIVKSQLAGLMANMSYVRPLKHLLTVFLFVYLGTELQTGAWISFFAVISAFASYTLGRHIKYHYYKTVSLLSGTALSMSIFTLAFLPSLVTYIIFGCVKELCKPMLSIPRRVYMLNLLATIPTVEDHRVEFMVVREWIGVGLGGVVGFLPLLFVSETNAMGLVAVLCFLGLVTFAEPLFLRSIKTDISR